MGGEGMPWNFILFVGIIGFLLGMNSAIKEKREFEAQAKNQPKDEQGPKSG